MLNVSPKIELCCLGNGCRISDVFSLLFDVFWLNIELFLVVGQEDLSQGLALASIWILIFAFGCTLCLVPIVYTISLAYQDPFSSVVSYDSQAANLEFLATVNGILFMGIGSVTGYTLASAAGKTSNNVIFILLLTAASELY